MAAHRPPVSARPWLLLAFSLTALHAFGCKKTTAESQGLDAGADTPFCPTASISAATTPLFTRVEFDKLDDDQVEDAVFERVSGRIQGEPSTWHQQLASLGSGPSMVYATRVVEGEVFNGGFNQLFFNSSRGAVCDAVAGYRLIGADRHADLVDEAIKVHVAERKKLEPILKDRTLEGFSESYKHTELRPLDDKFYEMDRAKAEDVSALRIRYIRSHLTEFVGN